MTVELTVDFEALEDQAAKIMAHFSAAGYERVAPSLIQPASLFLDRIGEAIRARTYVFFDPGGEELCLRPDLTVPVARIFMERGPKVGPAKYCYNGPAFRMQEGRPDPLRPREFRQAGIEYFGEPGAEADAEVVALSLKAVREAGLDRFIVKVGHLGVFSALLAALPMPERWRQRLARAFWRPRAFLRLLSQLARNGTGRTARPLPFPPPFTEPKLLEFLAANRIPFIGLRSPQEIVTRLIEEAADVEEPGLSQEVVDLITRYLRLHGQVEATLEAARSLFAKAGLDLDRPLAEAGALFTRVTGLAAPCPIEFAADFGRHFEYYTGMVFQIEIEGAGVAGHIAGGGRYDGLIGALSGGQRQAAAVGAAIHTERLLAAVRRA